MNKRLPTYSHFSSSINTTIIARALVFKASKSSFTMIVMGPRIIAAAIRARARKGNITKAGNRAYNARLAELRA